MYKVHIAEHGDQAQNIVSALMDEGFSRENIYIFAHDLDRSKAVTSATLTGDIGTREQGIFESFSNLFKSRGDELRSKMEAVGLSEKEADQFEKELDLGKLVIIGSDESLN